MKKPQDHQPPAPTRREYADAQGRATERMSEYFDFARFPEKADRKVTRNELLAFLTQLERARRSLPWYARLWRNLIRQPGSSPAEAVE